MNILVVDDEMLIRTVIKEYLLNEKYNVFESENGFDAIRVFKEEKIDLVILDIMMPKMDGFTALKEMKKIKDTPVIMLSAMNDEMDKLNGFNLGVDDYITKPFSPKELIARVKAVLKRSDKIKEIYKYKNLEIDIKGHRVLINEEEIIVTPEMEEELSNNKGEGDEE